MSNLEALSKKVSRNVVTELSENIASISNDINKDTIKNVIPEMVFKEYFLDFFMSGNDNGNPLLLSKWIELAGGYYNEVSVLDDMGNHIYDVPSVFVNPSIDPKVISNYNFPQIAMTYLLKKRRMEVEGTNYLAAVLSNLPDAINVEVNNHIMRWQAIFNRYTNNAKNTNKKELPNKTVNKPDPNIFG